jgi:hypothetical protein
MKLVKTIPHMGGLPDCACCKQAETKLLEQAAYGRKVTVNTAPLTIVAIVALMLPMPFLVQSAGAAASACLIGEAAVAMLKQGQRLNAEAAREQPYKVCKVVGKLNPEAVEGIDDYVNVMVQRMAEGCRP